MNTSPCPICASFSTQIFFERRNVPVHQHTIFKNFLDATLVNRGDLRMANCEDCGFVFNIAFDPEKLSYAVDYDNRQDCSPLFHSHIQNLVEYITFKKGIQNCSVVEIGCGKGSFLKKLIGLEGSQNRAIGFDPSYVGPESLYDGRLQFRKTFFEGGSDLKPDAIICRHVIEHISSPLSFLDSIKNSMHLSLDTRIFIETPSVEWILNNLVLWDLFYEHCSLFSVNSLKSAFEISGFQVDEIFPIFKDQYLWLEGSVKSNKKQIKRSPKALNFSAKAFSAKVEEQDRKWKMHIACLSKAGKVAVWGAGAKGVTFVNLLDPDREFIDCLIDINPNKQNCFVPGSGHPIFSPNHLKERKVLNIIPMNPNYNFEINTLLKQDCILANLVENLNI